MFSSKKSMESPDLICIFLNKCLQAVLKKKLQLAIVSTL